MSVPSSRSVAPQASQSAEWRLHPAWEGVAVMVFAVVLALPAVGAFGGLDLERARDEDRDLAPFPDIAATWTAMTALPVGLSRYVEDHLAFRARLVRWQATFRVLIFRVSPLPAVIRGRDGWLFYADDGALEDYTRGTPFSVAELATWSTTLQHTQDWLAAQGITYLFVIAPDKHVIYPEFMPASIRPGRGQSRTDQLVAYLRVHSTVPVLDLRPALMTAKGRDRLYHRTDTHWNDRGAVVAYRHVLERVGTLQTSGLTGLAPWSDAAFVPRSVPSPGWDLADMMGLTSLLGEQDLVLEPRSGRAAVIVDPSRPDPKYIEGRLVTQVADSSLPRAVVFRDSFGSALVPFLAEHFSRAVFLWEYDVDPAVVMTEHPQIVIQEWAGRRLGNRMPYDGIPAAVPSSPRRGAPVSSTGVARR